MPKKPDVLASPKSQPAFSGMQANLLDLEQPIPHRAAASLRKVAWWEAPGMQGGKSAVRASGVSGAGRDWVRSPGDRRLENKPRCWVRAQSRLCSLRWEGGQLGAEDALERAARWQAGPLRRPARRRAAAIAERRKERKKKKSELKSSFERNSPGKCVKTGTGTVLKSRAMFHLISIVRGENRKC